MTWYSDNSRYMAGFACPWIRLLRYHAQGTGWVPQAEVTETSVGHSLHANLEALYQWTKNHDHQLPAKSDVDSIIETEEPEVAEIVGLTHGYARAILPWIVRDYEIVATEKEHTLDIGSGTAWMARPDLILRARAEPHHLVVVDFKSTRSKADRICQIDLGSLQSIMNCYAVSRARNEAIGEMQIHGIQIGRNPWFTPITHAYYRAGQPPFVAEDWQAKPRKGNQWLGKLYRKVRVSDFRPIQDWVWEMDEDALTEQFPVAIQGLNDPSETGLKTIQALHSIPLNESQWRGYVEKIDWEKTTLSEISQHVPRTFACVQYSRACEFASVCFDLRIQSSPASLPDGMEPRTPHHPQEEID